MAAEQTKENILAAATALFAQYGYDSATTRSIANKAGVNIATIAFHFQNKEMLCKAVRERAADDLNHYFDKTLEKVKTVIDDEAAERETILNAIELLIGSIIELTLDHSLSAQIKLLFWEQMHSSKEDLVISHAAVTRCEKPLICLIAKLSPSMPYEKAVILSRFILGGIISYEQYPFFLADLKNRFEYGTLSTYIHDTLTPFIVSSVGSCLPSRTSGAIISCFSIMES